MYEELVKRLREESEIERWLQPHSANETPKLLDDAAHAIEELSKERKTGKWFIDGNGTLRCSECEEEALLTLDAIEDVPFSTFSESHFCPNCGAKMEGSGNDV